MATHTVPPRAAEALADRSPSRRGWTGRMSGGHVLIVVAGLAAAVGNLAVLRSFDDRVPAVVAAADLERGVTVDAGTFTLAQVAVPAAMATTLLDPEAEIDGWVLAVDLPAGAPVRADDVRPPRTRAGQQAMSLPVDPAHAAGGAIRIGDRVDVIATTAGEAAFVARDVEVLAVTTPAPGALGASSAFTVTLAVDDATALALAAALHADGLEVVRTAGSEPSAVQSAEPSAVQSAEPSAVQSAEPSAVQSAEPSAVRSAEPS